MRNIRAKMWQMADDLKEMSREMYLMHDCDYTDYVKVREAVNALYRTADVERWLADDSWLKESDDPR